MTTAADSIRGALVGLRTGDALGARIEGLEPSVVRHRYGAAGELFRLKPGRSGSATDMTLAVAESLAANPRLDCEDLARRLADGYDAGRVYGRGTADAIERLRSGVPWTDAGHVGAGRGCAGNAAAVRSAPIGLAGTADIDWIRWAAEEAAGITHQNTLGTEGAVVFAVAVALAAATRGHTIERRAYFERLAGETPAREYRARLERGARLAEETPTVAAVVDTLGNNQTALGSVATAVYCFIADEDDFAAAVCRALSLGGNTTSIAAMTGALSGAHLGIDAIPDTWLSVADGDPVGVDRVRDVAGRFADSLKDDDVD